MNQPNPPLYIGIDIAKNNMYLCVTPYDKHLYKERNLMERFFCVVLTRKAYQFK